ncbi:hypothetical protein F4810DRAFT_676556 [Camillea tinctor]|nr:hypothetical protein F4810DRAFT_676556 [Camillea tinctor]
MASMSRNASSSNSLMGFSVHQPAIGATLQFFPTMGSQQLDEMINAYVPGNASIQDKRAIVSMEFFEHTMATGEPFKFFMVYPYLGNTVESPTNSSVMQDSGYGSGFNTSPVMSESQWTQMSNASPSSSSSHKTRTSTAKKAVATSTDFSNIPGMKIMTKDGRDITNSASRGCKTKEQRDHAHLMRIIKACDACRKKKIRCDPSHKRRVAGSSEAKVTKKAKVTRPTAAPQRTVGEVSPASSFDSAISDSIQPIDFGFPELNMTSSVPMEWDQFIQYDEEPTDTVPYDYDFFSDPAGFFSPATSATNTSSTSPYQPITPMLPTTDTGSTPAIADPAEAVTLPYLKPGGLEGGSNYVDFNLYSPGSSIGLDDDPSFINEVSALPGLDRSENSNIRPQQVDLYRDRLPSPDREYSIHRSAFQAVDVLDRSFTSQDEVIYTTPDHYGHYDPQSDRRQSDRKPDTSQPHANDCISSGGTGRGNIQGHDDGKEERHPAPNGRSTQDLLNMSQPETSGSESRIEHSHPISGRNILPLQSILSTSPAQDSSAQHCLIKGRPSSVTQHPVEANGDYDIFQHFTDKLPMHNPTYDTSRIETTSSSLNSFDHRKSRHVYPNSQVLNEPGSDIVTSSGSEHIPPLPSPDRPPVISVAFSNRATSKQALVSNYTRITTAAPTTPDTLRACGSTSASAPEQTILYAATSWSVTESASRIASLRSTLSSMCRNALNSIFGQKRAAAPVGAAQTHVQRQARSSPNHILLAIAGLCGIFYVLSFTAFWLIQIGSDIQIITLLVVASYIKLLQHSAPSVDDKVSTPSLSPLRQPHIAITESTKRRYVALQSDISTTIQRSFEKGSPASLLCIH